MTDARAKRVRILRLPGRRPCQAHEWAEPWPDAVVKRCARCKAWMVPAL